MGHRLQKDSLLPRIIWVDKSITLKQLHFQIFEMLRHPISEWIDFKDPQSNRKFKDHKIDIRSVLKDFPNKPENWDPMIPFTKQDFN